MQLPDGIRQRGGSLLIDVSVHGVRRTATVRGLDLSVALVKRESLRAELLGTIQPTGNHSWTLRQAYNKTCELYWNPREAKSWEKLRQTAEFVLTYFGEAANVSTITTTKVDEFIAHLKVSGIAGSTINRKTAALSKMLATALREDRLTKKPSIKRQKETPAKVRFLSREEEQAILGTFDQWGQDEVSEIICVLIDTGVRPSSLWEVTAQDVDRYNGVLHVQHTKRDNPYGIPMTSRVKDILTRRSSLIRTGSLFPYTTDWLDDKWSRMRNHLGYEQDTRFTAYICRHTCASRLVQRGVPLQVVKEWLGHKNILTTQRYAFLCPKNLLDAVKVLES
jgi:integrase